VGSFAAQRHKDAAVTKMRLELTRRDAIILGIFIPFLVACCYAYVRHTTAPRAPSQAVGEVTTAGATEPAAQADAQDVNVDIDGILRARSMAVQRYVAIWERNVFKPVVLAHEEGARTPRMAAVNTAAPPPLQPLPPPMSVQTQPPESTHMTREHRAPEKPKDMAYTAFVLVNGKPVALIENLGTKEGMYVQEGDHVFGMRVLRIAPDAIELERDGHSFYYALGENKEKRELMARSVSQQRAPSASPSGSQQQSAVQSQQTVQTGQTEQTGQQVTSQSPPSPPTFEGRSRFFEQMMQRMRERYGDNIPPDVMERIRRFRRRFSEEGN